MLRLRAKALQELGRAEEHEKLLYELIGLCSRETSNRAFLSLSVSIRCALGTIYLKKKELAKASLYLEEALEISSNNFPANSTVALSVTAIHRKIQKEIQVIEGAKLSGS